MRLRFLLRYIHIMILDLPYNRQIRNQFVVQKDSIIVVTHDLQKYGGEILALNIVRKLTEEGAAVTVLSLRPGVLYDDFAKYAPVNVAHGKRLLKFFSFARSKGCCNCICNTIISGEVACAAKQNGFRVITLIHEMERGIKEHYGKKYLNTCNQIVENSNEIIFPSNYVRSSFEKCIEKKLINPIIRDQGLYFPENCFADELSVLGFLKEKGIESDDRVVINVAVGSYRKGFDLFLEVAEYVEQINERIKFIWVGGEVSKIYTEYTNKHGSIHLKNLVLIDYIDDIGKLNSINRFSKLLFLSSREDPFPAVVLNSFSVGTPVVAFEKSGGFADIVKNDLTGFLIQPYDTKAVSEKILDIIFDDDMLNNLGKNCIEESKRHSFSEYIRFLLELFEADKEKE